MSEATHKTCKICGEVKPLSEFYRKASGKFGVTAECKICRCLKDGFTPIAFREKLPDGMKRCTSCKQLLPETADYFVRNGRCHNGLLNVCKECRSAKRNAEYQNSPELQAKTTERARQWRKNNPQKRAILGRNENRRRRNLLYNAEGSHTDKDVKRQYAAQKGRCYYCGEPLGELFTEDHVIPLSRGGSDWPSNIVCACRHCNYSKGDKLPSEWSEGGKLL